MSETVEPTEEFPVDLRALIRQRKEQNLRRTYRQWFTFDTRIATELATAEKELVDLTLVHLSLQTQSREPRKGKYAAPNPLQQAQAKVDELRAQAARVGACAVFQAPSSTVAEDLRVREYEGSKGEQGNARARDVLLTCFAFWETIDGDRIPEDTFGRPDLEMLLDPDLLEQSEFLPIAVRIIEDVGGVVDRPTSLRR